MNIRFGTFYLIVGLLGVGCGEQSNSASDQAEQAEGSTRIVEEDVGQDEDVTLAETTTAGEGLASNTEGDLPWEGDITVQVDTEEEELFPENWTETQHVIMETARNLYPTYKLLHQYAVGPGCGPITGVCHNTKEYPDLHSSANMLDAVGLNCNALIDGPAVTENVCERPADQLIITSGDDVGFLSPIGNLIVTPQSVGCGEEPVVVPDEESDVCVPKPELPTYESGVDDIIQARCGSCHGSPPVNAPFSLTSYEEIIKPTIAAGIYRYDRVLARMQAQTMPPGGGNSDEDIQLVADWVENCHTQAGEDVVATAVEEDPVEDLCILLKDPINMGTSDGELGIDFSILRKDPSTQQSMVLVEYDGMLQTTAGSSYVRFPGFSELTAQEQSVFLYTVIPGDPNGDGVYGADSGEGGLLINPGKPGMSYFVWRMMGWGAAPQMPLAGEPLLPPAQLGVMCWIANMEEGDALDAMEEIDYSNCYELLDHFEGVEFDPDAARDH